MRPDLRRRITVSVEELGGLDRLLVVHIRAHILVHITHSVFELALGFWKGKGEISWRFWGKLQRLLYKLVAEDRGSKKDEDGEGCIYMALDSTYRISSS